MEQKQHEKRESREQESVFARGSIGDDKTETS